MSILKGLKSLVSQDRIRYQQDGFDLDLSYITDNMLAMSIPSSGVAAMWRNKIKDVHRLLYTRHGDGFMIWNLSETKYNYDLFDNQILDFPFPDHHAPPIILLATIVKSIDGWIQASKDNVAVVHCKGGKGRTGIVIICWLMYSGIQPFMKDAMRLFAEKRSSTKKGVTQPSQLRYVNYFSMIISRKVKMTVRKLMVSEIVIGPLPLDAKISLNIMTYSDSYDSKCAFSIASDSVKVEQINGSEMRVVIPVGIVVSRDFLIVARQKNGKELFHMSLNTCFIENTDHTEAFCRKELDCFEKSILYDTIVMIKIKKTSDIEEVDEAFMARVLEMQKIYSERVTRKLMEQNKTTFGASRRLKSTAFLESSSPSASAASLPQPSVSPVSASAQDQPLRPSQGKPLSETPSIIIGKEKLLIKEEEEAAKRAAAAKAEAEAAAAKAAAEAEAKAAAEREQKAREEAEQSSKRGKGGRGDSDVMGRVRMMIKHIEDGDNRDYRSGRPGDLHNDGSIKKFIREFEKPKEYVSNSKVEIVGDVNVKQMVQKIESINQQKIEMQIQKVRARESMMITPEQLEKLRQMELEMESQPEPAWLKNVRISGARDNSLGDKRYSFMIHVDNTDKYGLPGDDEFEISDTDSDYESDDDDNCGNVCTKQTNQPVQIKQDNQNVNTANTNGNAIPKNEKPKKGVRFEEKEVIINETEEKKEEQKENIPVPVIVEEEKKEEKKVEENEENEEKPVVITEVMVKMEEKEEKPVAITEVKVEKEEKPEEETKPIILNEIKVEEEKPIVVEQKVEEEKKVQTQNENVESAESVPVVLDDVQPEKPQEQVMEPQEISVQPEEIPIQSQSEEQAMEPQENLIQPEPVQQPEEIPQIQQIPEPTTPSFEPPNEELESKPETKTIYVHHPLDLPPPPPPPPGSEPEKEPSQPVTPEPPKAMAPEKPAEPQAPAPVVPVVECKIVIDNPVEQPQQQPQEPQTPAPVVPVVECKVVIDNPVEQPQQQPQEPQTLAPVVPVVERKVVIDNPVEQPQQQQPQEPQTPELVVPVAERMVAVKKPEETQQEAPKVESKPIAQTPPSSAGAGASEPKAAKEKDNRPAIIIGVNKVYYRRMLAAQNAGSHSASSSAGVSLSLHQTKSMASLPSKSPDAGSSSATEAASASSFDARSSPMSRGEGNAWSQAAKPRQRADNAFKFFRK